METCPSFASLLTRKNPAMSYGHGWIVSENGKRWHPDRDQSELLNGLTAKKVSAVKRLLSALLGAK